MFAPHRPVQLVVFSRLVLSVSRKEPPQQVLGGWHERELGAMQQSAIEGRSKNIMVVMFTEVWRPQRLVVCNIAQKIKLEHATSSAIGKDVLEQQQPRGVAGKLLVVSQLRDEVPASV